MIESDSGASLRTLRMGGRRDGLVGPDVRDPRLHVAMVVVSLQVLGQTVLHFDVSVAQILIAVATCAVIEVAITLWRDHVLAWPASALLTGNGVAFVLRIPGTRHGDWWSMRGGWIIAAVAAVSLSSKYLIRVNGRPLFNPSNFGLVLAFLLLGSRRVDPLELWWVRPGIALALALTVIIVGGLLLAWRVKMLGVIASFWLTYAAALGVLAVRGHCITARWHIGPVCNGYLWTVLVTSPEVAVFMFFMITDPKTAPHGRTARKVYGAAIAFVFVALAAPQRTEYATKVALLGALALVCASRPILERLSPAADPQLSGQTAQNNLPAFRRPNVRNRVRLIAVTAVIVVACAAIVVGAGTPASTSRVAPVAPSAPVSCADRAATSTPQPRPTLRAIALPTITVQNAINVSTRISARVARQIVRDVIDDLAIAGDAITRRAPALAADIGRFPWIDDLIATICASQGPLVVSSYHIAEATVTIAKRTRGQVFPEIDVALDGAVHTTTLSRSRRPHQLAEHTEQYHNTLVVTKTDDYWLICGNRSDPRTSACITTT